MQQWLPVWKQAPFFRILLPFVAGICVQHYTSNDPRIAWVLVFTATLTWGIFSCLSLSLRHAYYPVQGVSIQTALFSVGCIVCAEKNPFEQKNQVDAILPQAQWTVAALLEPALEKKSSWKALCSIEVIGHHQTIIKPNTNVIVYFRKTGGCDSIPSYGQRIRFTSPLLPIENHPTFGQFDYVRYCALKNIHYQTFLAPSDYETLEGDASHAPGRLVFSIQEWTVSHLKKFIPGSQECGLALALLIGYKNDLDKQLLSAYSNTGVVHVIAISGLHLGVIYLILAYLCKPLALNRGLGWLKPVIIISGLWLFSLLAGASPSVLRSAVMFTGIVLGETGGRKTSLLNNLFASAFLLLCYDPFWLWDLGFQLSYTALLSIAIFARPVYHWWSPSNTIINYIWQMNSVTLAAQLLTLPILLYQFHQFPNFFLLANFFAIPASTIILITEMLLCTFFFLPAVSGGLGWLITHLIRLMNLVIQWIDQLPYSSAKNIDINFLQLIALYCALGFTASWLMLNNKKYLVPALLSVILFFAAGLKIWQ